jgi:hypothetical protein
MSRRIVGTLVAAALAALVLTGCVEEPTPTPTPTSSASPSATPTPPADPELDLEGTAADNLDYFDLVNRRLIDGGGTLDGRAFVDNLVAAGFPKTDLEVTPDRTAINIAADNIQFAVRINGGCLIGQYGNVGYASTTAPLLATGRCLVGETRPIDW